MTSALSGPLETRPNPSAWASLLDLALPALDHALPDERDALSRGSAPRWTLGGGTALALRIGHRISDDIDIFLSGVSLKLLTPGSNPVAQTISPKFDWPGHYLKYHRTDGEIDFLSSALLTEPGFSREAFRGRTVALETIDEVMVKKLRYRSHSFTLRDAFDLACVAKSKPETILTLAKEISDTIPRATLALSSLSNEKVRIAVRPSPAFRDVLEDPIDQAKEALKNIAWFRDNPISKDASDIIEYAVSAVTWFKPGRRPGTVNFGWDDPTKSHDPDMLAVFKDRSLEAKAALLKAWRLRDPQAFHDWDARGRPAATRERTIAARPVTGRER